MSAPNPPGEPGYDPDRWFQHVVNVGLQLARKVGTGLPLVNALASRFRDVGRSILGAAATILGQGIRAAASWNMAGPDAMINLDDLPLAPKGFFPPGEVDRIVGIADIAGKKQSTGETEFHQQSQTWPEDWSKSSVDDVIESVINDHSEGNYDWQAESQNAAHMLWIGKRF